MTCGGTLRLRMISICMAAVAFSVAAHAISEDSATIHRIEVEVVPGRLLHTNDFLKGFNTEVRTMNHSFVARLKYAFAPPEGSEQALIYKGVYQGAGLAFHSFNPQLGNPVSLYLFQGATVKTLSQRLSLNYEWDFGLTYGWKTYDRDTNPENRVIGSKLTAYIDLGFYLRWMLSRNWDLNIGASVSHYSNGNTAIPNAGLNAVGAKASVAYYINREEKHHAYGELPAFDRHWGWDLTLYGAWKRRGMDTNTGTYALPGVYGVAGFTLNPLYHVNHWSPWYQRVALGLSARAEFVMPYFTINFGIGHNFVNAHTEDMKGFYEILALKIKLMRQSYLHIGYSLYDFYYPNNLMLGIGFHL